MWTLLSMVVSTATPYRRLLSKAGIGWSLSGSSDFSGV